MSQKDVKPEQIFEIKDEYAERYGFKDENTKYTQTDKGLTEDTIREISRMKSEPDWMLEKRLDAYRVFMSKPVPTWGPDLSEIDFADVYYYSKPDAKKSNSWDQVPEDIKRTFDKLGIPESEKKFFGGAEAQYDSEVIYHNVRKDLEAQGVIFTDTDTAVKKYPDIVKKYFGKLVPSSDNKFAALNTACWSGGSFIYVPKGVRLKLPLQAYFRINTEKSGQFERTLIIADEGAEVVYVEGCFTKGTEITTSTGIKAIEEVSVNDQVMTHKGRYRRVYHTQVRPYTGKMYKISYYGDTSTQIEATEEHPFLVSKKGRLEYKNTNFEVEWTNASSLNKGDYIALPINREVKSEEDRLFTLSVNRKEVALNLHTDADFFRLVGYYLAEGSMTGVNGDSYLYFTFNKDEGEYISDVVQLLEKYFGKKPYVQKEYKNGISIVLCSTLAARFFRQQFGKGAGNKSLPRWVLNENVEKQKELVKGFWRGDGSFMNKNYDYGAKRMFRINTISKVLAKQVRDVLLRLNILASINKQNRSGNRHTMYCVYVGGENLVNFADAVDHELVEEVSSGNTKLLMRINQIKTTSSFGQIVGDYAFLPIKDISCSNVENMPVYNFSVEEDESYIASGAAVHNCTAPIYSSSSLHSAIVEIVVHKNAHVRYVTIQNWSKNVYNLVTQRAFVYENGAMEWIDCNIGSKINMKYPSIFLKERGSKGEIVSVAIAGEHQIQDSGGKIYHMAPDTTSKLISKGVSKGTGVASYRGLMHIDKNATNVKTSVRCDSLLLGDGAKANTYPYMEINSNDAAISHEASVSKISDDNLFYLMSRGISEEDAIATIVFGFINDLTEVLPLEYSLELKRLIKLDTTGSVG